MHDALEPRLPHPPPRQLIVHERGPYFLTLVPVRVEHAKQRRPRARRRRPLVVLRVMRPDVDPYAPYAPTRSTRSIIASPRPSSSRSTTRSTVASSLASSRARVPATESSPLPPSSPRARVGAGDGGGGAGRARFRRSRFFSPLWTSSPSSSAASFRARASAEPPATDAIDATPPRAARACAEGRRRR